MFESYCCSKYSLSFKLEFLEKHSYCNPVAGLCLQVQGALGLLVTAAGQVRPSDTGRQTSFTRNRKLWSFRRIEIVRTHGRSTPRAWCAHIKICSRQNSEQISPLRSRLRCYSNHPCRISIEWNRSSYSSGNRTSSFISEQYWIFAIFLKHVRTILPIHLL